MESSLKKKQKKTKKNKYDEELVQINGWIDKNTRDIMRREHISITQAVELGVRAYHDNPQLMKRLRYVEERLEYLLSSHKRLLEKYYSLEQKK